MVPPDAKWFQLVPPQAIVDDASWSPNEIDTLGFKYLEVIVSIGALDIAMTVLKLQDSDAAGGSFTDITGLVFGTSINDTGSASSLPSATDDDELFVFNVSLLGLERFIDLVATIGNGSTGGYLSAIARLSRGETAPNAAAEFGASQVLQVPAFAA